MKARTIVTLVGLGVFTIHAIVEDVVNKRRMKKIMKTKEEKETEETTEFTETEV